MNGAAIIAIARAALIDASRRKDAAVMGIFGVCFLLFLVAARFVGIEDAATGTFLLNLSLTTVTGLSHLLTCIIAARQLPDEFENRTLYPLLARPLHRSDVLLGKWSAAVLMGLLAFVVLLIPVFLLAPRMESYNTGTLLQLLTLQPAALMLTAAIPMLCALFLPRGLALFSALLWIFGAGMLPRLISAIPRWRWLPDPGHFNLVLRYTDGIHPLPPHEWIFLLLAALLWTVGLLALATRIFQRRAL